MIKTPLPSYDSNITDTILQLEHLRGRSTSSTMSPQLFAQLRDLFHIIEALSSARIEGNYTTLAGFVEQRAQKDTRNTSDESTREILNLMEGLDFIDQHIEDDLIDQAFIQELHRIVVKDLKREGDVRAGGWRDKDVSIANSNHVTPSHYDVPDLMRELIFYINDSATDREEVLKIAIAHHRFVWVHPFGNGNGRTVRLLTYAMLCKKGYIKPNSFRLFNPTSVFAKDRDKYYSMLERVDTGTNEGLLEWSEYFLSGVKGKTEKTLRLACITLVDTYPRQCIASRFDNGVNFQLCDNTGSNYNCVECWEVFLEHESKDDE